MVQSHMVFEESLDVIIEEALDPEFGDMTSKKAVMADAGNVPDWRIQLGMRNFLRGQADIKKRKKEKTRRRQRDVGHDEFRRIVDGRAIAGTT